MKEAKPNLPEGPREMVAHALRAYELARANYLQDEVVARAEQERAGQLLSAIQEVERAARDLLEKAGLAHIAGAPLQLEDEAAPVRRSDEAVTAAFVQAQTAYVDLRTTLCRLAEAQLEAGLWEDARRTLQPLLADQGAPLYAEARDLLCESYYRPGKQALEAEQWRAARSQFKAVVRIDASYRDAGDLLRASYLRPARKALEAGEWEAVRQHIEPWLKEHKNDGEARDLLCESYYRPALAALQAEEWETACSTLRVLLKLEASYRDAAERLRQVLGHWLGLDFIRIPAGEFLYGENRRREYLDEFWISRTPVTNAQYRVFVEVTGHGPPSHWSGGLPPKGKEQHPVVYVSWEDAQAFCRWAGVRLPSEREWEKAARGTDGRTYPWGEEPPNPTRCNFNDQVGDTTAVGSYPAGASPYGVLDMAGNVWEWCEDRHEKGGRMLRGGAFINANGVRCAARLWGNPNYRCRYYGFRVVAPS